MTVPAVPRLLEILDGLLKGRLVILSDGMLHVIDCSVRPVSDHLSSPCRPRGQFEGCEMLSCLSNDARRNRRSLEHGTRKDRSLALTPA